MKLLLQISLVFGLYWLSEGVERLLPLPIPASVLSLVILLALLCVKAVKEEHVQEVADFLLGDLALFFVPAAVGIIRYVELLQSHAAAFLTVCLVSTVLTFAATSGTVYLTRKLMKKGAAE